MKRIMMGLLSVCLVLSIVLCAAPGVLAQEGKTENIVVLYTNDVHCGVDADSPEGTMGYVNLAALKKEMEAEHAYVTLIDAGDAIQGEAIGTLSKGSYLVDIMNEIGYDYAVFGNHEFDYGMDVALSLPSQSEAEYLACNFVDLRTGELVAQPYSIAQYGDLKVAYVGIATPESFTKSTPAYFQDENGNYIYGFCEGNNGQELYDAVQTAIDEAVSQGADVVVAVGHLGTDPASAPWRSYDVIANTTGLDAFIDAHSHSVIAGEQVSDADGNTVLLSSTGTKLANIGMLTITLEGAVSTQLVTGYTQADEDTDVYIKSIQSEYEGMLNEVVAQTQVRLVVNDPETGERIIRSQETNLGDLCADAYRIVLGADVAMVNGGGIRSDIEPGDITYGDIIAVHPFGNMMCVVEASGQELLDTLEVAAKEAPNENGGFQHVSGLKYTINTAIPSSVEMDDKGMLVSIGESRRVTDVQILQEDGTYAPIDPEAIYTLASHNYMIKSQGAGVTFFDDNQLLQDEVMIDNQVLINYIRDHLNGVIGEEYENPYGQGRITITNETAEENEATKDEATREDGPVVEENPKTADLLPVVLVVMPAVLLTLWFVLRRRGTYRS